MAYWLMKSEPGCYSIADLERDGASMWEGCRNYTVRNFLRDRFQVGDEAFFFHSNAEPSGIAGTMRVVRAAYPDPTQFDPDSEHFDPKSRQGAPRWLAVDVAFGRRFPRVLPLAELRAAPGLEGMEVLRRGQRLSVMPVTAAEWAIVLRLADGDLR
jgi:predicted RNA-binding protein with PUA-like domain